MVVGKRPQSLALHIIARCLVHQLVSSGTIDDHLFVNLMCLFCHVLCTIPLHSIHATINYIESKPIPFISSVLCVFSCGVNEQGDT